MSIRTHNKKSKIIGKENSTSTPSTLLLTTISWVRTSRTEIAHHDHLAASTVKVRSYKTLNKLKPKFLSVNYDLYYFTVGQSGYYYCILLPRGTAVICRRPSIRPSVRRAYASVASLCLSFATYTLWLNWCVLGKFWQAMKLYVT